MKLILLTMTITLSSCCETQYIAKPLNLPPDLGQIITKEEASSMPKELRDKVILIDKRRKTLRGIIGSTHYGF